MKAKIVSIVLAVLLVGLSGFSASEIMILKNQVTAQTAQIAAKEAQIAELKSEVEAKDARIVELEKENAKLRKEVDGLKELAPAKIEISFNPNPVPVSEDGLWRWRTFFTEVSGNVNACPVKLNNIIWLTYNNNLFKGYKAFTSNDGSDGGRWLNEAYLLANDSTNVGCSRPYMKNVTHLVIIVNGVDYKGNEIIAKGRLDVLSP